LVTYYCGVHLSVSTMATAGTTYTKIYDVYKLSKLSDLVTVLIVEEGGEPIYKVIEPPLDEVEFATFRKVIDGLRSVMPATEFRKMSKEELWKFIRGKAESLAKKFLPKKYRTDVTLEKILYYVRRDIVEYGKITPLIYDDLIEDISISKPNSPVYIWHSEYEYIKTNILLTEIEINDLTMKIAQKSKAVISRAEPIVDATLPEGHRAHIVLRGVAYAGTTIAIRKLLVKPFTPTELINRGTVSAEIMAYLWLLMDFKKSVLIYGDVGAGKTTLANAISLLIKPEYKVVTIEETREIRLPHKNWVALVTREFTLDGLRKITLFDLLKSSLRQRPDYIIVGEIRGEEAYTLFQAIAVGHGGITTMHADTLESVIYRLTSEPMNIPPSLISLIQAFINIKRMKIDAKITRKVWLISEPRLENGGLNFTHIVKYNPKTNLWEYHFNESQVLRVIANYLGIEFNELIRRLEARTRYLKYLVTEGVTNFEDFVNAVRQYKEEEWLLLTGV